MMNKMFKKGVALLGGVMMLLNMALPGFTYAEEDIKTTLDQLYQDLTRMLDADISTTRFVPGTLEGLLTNGECQELKDKYSKFIPFDGPIQSSDPRFSQYRYTEKNVHRSLLGIVGGVCKDKLGLSSHGVQDEDAQEEKHKEDSIRMIHVNSQPEIPGITVKVVKGTIVGDRCQGEEVLNKGGNLRTDGLLYEGLAGADRICIETSAPGYDIHLSEHCSRGGEYTFALSKSNGSVQEVHKENSCSNKPETGNSGSAGQLDPAIAEKQEKVNTIKLIVGTKQELSPTEVNTISYAGGNGTNSLAWEGSLPAGLEMKECTLVGEDNISYNRHGEQAKDNGKPGSQNPMFFAGCGGLFGGAYHSAKFKDQVYTLTVDFGDEVKKIYKFKFVRLADIEWKTDYDPTKSSNEMAKNYYVARSATPLVDVKEGAKLDGNNPARYQHLMFLYKVNNLDGAEKVRYEIRLNDAQGDVIAYGSRSSATEVGGFYWSFRDWRADPQFKAEDIEKYTGGPAGLTVVEARNDDILKAGTKVVFIVKVKYAAGEQTIEYPYTITAQDVINATIGDKVTLTLMDGDKEISKNPVLKGAKLQNLPTPTKAGKKFNGWTTDKEGKKAYNKDEKVEADLTLYAQWKKRTSSTTSGGGGGSSSSSSNTTATTGAQAQTGAQLSGVVATGALKTLDSMRSGAVDQATATPTPEKAKQLEALKASLQSESNAELRDAYTYAYLRGMTTQPTIQQAALHRGLTRAEMAKMMSVFAVKVLGKSPVLTGTADYKDINEVNGDLPGYIQQAYQLQIMGIDAKGNPIVNFNPNAEVTRAEFATVLSRVLYGDKYNQEGADFAAKHLEALKAANILKDTTPSMKEMRGWVMLMLMRAEGVK